MIIQHIKHKNIDFKKWDQTVLASEIPFVFAQSFYLNATCPHWDALVIGDYESVFPLPLKTKYGITYLPQPPFTSQLGVFGKVTMEREHLFFNYINQKYRLIELEINHINAFQSEFSETKKTFVINYKKEYSFNQNTKRNIHKALELGLTVKHVDTNDIIPLSNQYITPFLHKQVGLSLSTIQKLTHLLQLSIINKQLHTFKVVDKQGDLKALGHFITNGIHTVYLKGTNTDKKENSGSSHLLMQHAIEYFKHNSLLFDFGGGNNVGLANYYKGFGAEEMNYQLIKKNNLFFLINSLKNRFKKTL